MNTSNGNMCGSEWDEYCHRLLSLKYSNYYQRVPSKFGGDLGIEGFVQHSGIVFQCYCPDCFRFQLIAKYSFNTMSVIGYDVG